MDELIAAEPNADMRDRGIARAAGLIEQQVARGKVPFAVNRFPGIHIGVIACAVTADFYAGRAQRIIYKAGTVIRIRAFGAQHIRLALLRKSRFNEGGKRRSPSAGCSARGKLCAAG